MNVVVKMFSYSDLCFGPCSTWAGVQQCLSSWSRHLTSSFQHDNGPGKASRMWPGLLDTLYPNLKGVAQLSRKLVLSVRGLLQEDSARMSNISILWNFGVVVGNCRRLGLMELAWMSTSLKSTKGNILVKGCYTTTEGC